VRPNSRLDSDLSKVAIDFADFAFGLEGPNDVLGHSAAINIVVLRDRALLPLSIGHLQSQCVG